MIMYNQLAFKMKSGLSEDLREDARSLGEILIQLYKEYPLFLKDVDPIDPDFNLDEGFKTYSKLEKLAHGKRANKI